MNTSLYVPQEILTKLGKITDQERLWIKQCRYKATKLGFCYQLIFVKVFNHFPKQEPLELYGPVLAYASLQTHIDTKEIEYYKKRTPTISEHQRTISAKLGLKYFDEEAKFQLSDFLHQEAFQIDQDSILMTKTRHFLRTEKIIEPAEYILKRLIAYQRKMVKKLIFEKISFLLTPHLKEQMNNLLHQPDQGTSLFQQFKFPPSIPSAHGLIALGKKLDILEKMELSTVDLSWFNNNYQRTLSKYAQQGSIDRLIQLKPEHRYAILICFLKQTYQDTLDHLVDMYFKLMNRIENSAEQQANEALQSSKKILKKSLQHFQVVTTLLLDDSIPDNQLRTTLFEYIEKEELEHSLRQTEHWLEGPAQHNLFFIMKRFSYLRQFTPHLLKHLACKTQDKDNKVVIQAITLLNTLNVENKRELPQDAPIKFIPKKLLPHVVKGNVIHRKAWECVLLSKLKYEIKSGNIAVQGSKRFCTLDEFFIDQQEWDLLRHDFFKRAQLPSDPHKVSIYLRKRLHKAFENFFDKAENNTYATIEDGQWVISTDKADTFSPEEAQNLLKLKTLLGSSMRSIKLPHLLIEVDNDIRFTNVFMSDSTDRRPDEICNILATLMAHGCFIGSYTMARLTPVSYTDIKRITDWQMTEDAQRQALSHLVHAISELDITHNWG